MELVCIDGYFLNFRFKLAPSRFPEFDTFLQIPLVVETLFFF